MRNACRKVINATFLAEYDLRGLRGIAGLITNDGGEAKLCELEDAAVSGWITETGRLWRLVTK
jgi:hypothetical protein